ncbi:MAG: carboxymuconolactone decarboxylase family protein [Halobacteriales archaeon]
MASKEQETGQPRENTLRLVSEEEATGKTKEIYEEVKGGRGDVDKDLDLSKLWLMYGNDPELLEHFWEHIDYTYNGGSLPYELKSKISMVVASVMECEGCRYFHESALENIGIDDDAIEGLMELQIEEIGFSPEEEVILQFAEKATRNPHDITDEDLEALRDIGLSEKELLEVFDCIAFHVYTAMMQGMAGIVYPGMSREEWTEPI